MSTAAPPFKRIVIDLHCSGCDRLIVQQAAELAQILQLELFGRFFADPALTRLAAMPFAREYRVAEREWHPMEGGNVSRELALAIAAAERLFEKIAASIPRRFLIVEDPGALEQELDGREENIAVIHENAYGSDSFGKTLESAFQNAASVLILPGGVPQKSGPILAYTNGTDDPAAGIAAALANAAGERLVCLDSHGDAPAPNARLIVTRRGTFGSTTLALIAARKKTPVLVVDAETM